MVATEPTKQAAAEQPSVDEEKTFDRNINEWSAAVVQEFLQHEQLSKMIPLCTGISGNELLSLYEMCKSSAVTMYHSLKSELSDVHRQVLPVATFLQFVTRVRVLLGDTNSFHICLPDDLLETGSVESDSST